VAGLVPAIHILQYFGMASGGYIYILTNRPNGVLARMEGENDCRNKPGLERSLRNHHEVKTWMAGTSPAMTVDDFPIQFSNSQVDAPPRSRGAMRPSCCVNVPRKQREQGMPDARRIRSRVRVGRKHTR
jgi:hypothetical protein